ncbi:MAG: alkaline phosphatase family protein [Planctomycetota bacterium]
MGKRHAKRVLLIGWDAADWNFLRPLISAGKMPALARLIENGVSGNLATIRPILSPMLWNSMATGKRADKHNILGFMEPTPDANGIRPVSSTSRTCKALWNILSQKGMESVVVNWFASHPAEPIRGTVVTDRYEAAAVARADQITLPDGAVHPASLRDLLAERIVTPDQLDANSLLAFLPHGQEIDQSKDSRVRQIAQLVAKTSTVHAAACHAARGDSWDFMGVYYGAIDQFGHHFMPYRPPQLEGISDEDVRHYGGVMEACYRFHDMMLAALMDYAGPETTIMLVSDHGFHHDGARPSTDATDDPIGWHRPLGVACMSGPGVRQGETLRGASLLDVTPTILTALGLPVGMDMDGRAWSEIFEAPSPVERIISWEGIDGDDGQHPADVREDPAAAAEAIRQLVDLGYMEAPDNDVQTTIDRVLLDHRTNLALALTDSRRCDDAVPLWEAMANDPKLDPDAALVQIARCHLKSNRFAEADAALDRLTETSQRRIATRLLRAQSLLGRKQTAQAAEVLESCRDEAPPRADLALSLGKAYLQLDRLDDAQDMFERVQELGEVSSAALDGLSQVALRRGEAALARDLALEAVSLTHVFPAAHLHLAEALVALNLNEDAKLAAQVALALAPGLKPAHALLARLGQGASPNAADRPAWEHDIASR